MSGGGEEKRRRGVARRAEKTAESGVTRLWSYRDAREEASLAACEAVGGEGDPARYRAAVYGEAHERLRACGEPRAVAAVGQLLFDLAGDPSGVEAPSRAQIAAALGCSPKSVDRAFASLVELGVVEVWRRGPRAGAWRLLVAAKDIGARHE